MKNEYVNWKSIHLWGCIINVVGFVACGFAWALMMSQLDDPSLYANGFLVFMIICYINILVSAHALDKEK